MNLKQESTLHPGRRSILSRPEDAAYNVKVSGISKYCSLRGMRPFAILLVKLPMPVVGAGKLALDK